MNKHLALILFQAMIASLHAPLQATVHANETTAERGYRLLTTKAYLPADFHQTDFDDAWQVWPEPLRNEAAEADRAGRRSLAFTRYGLTPRPDDPGRPLQYVVDEAGNWTMNCFACHGGQVAGHVIPGLPNSNFALMTLTEEIRQTKLAKNKPLSRMDIGSMFMPLGTSNGTTNAVMFGVALSAYRDADLNIHLDRPLPDFVHHDMDAPAWWQFHRKSHIYADAFAPKSHRALMQFLLVRENSPEKFHEWEADYRDIYAFLESLRPPRYPFAVDVELAAAGRTVFDNNCAKCHGDQGSGQPYPGHVISIDEVATDRVRLDALTVDHRRGYARSWFAADSAAQTDVQPIGYVAPPLDGVWATAPYLHNGSVPTLWHLLHASERPRIWRRSVEGYDVRRVGLEVQVLGRLPRVKSSAELREYFDTRRAGKSADGHLFPEVLSADEKTAVLEYLKTL